MKPIKNMEQFAKNAAEMATPFDSFRRKLSNVCQRFCLHDSRGETVQENHTTISETISTMQNADWSRFKVAPYSLELLTFNGVIELLCIT